jgi:hypothetical protein
MQTPESDYGTMHLNSIRQEGKAEPAEYKLSASGQTVLG